MDAEKAAKDRTLPDEVQDSDDGSGDTALSDTEKAERDSDVERVIDTAYKRLAEERA